MKHFMNTHTHTHKKKFISSKLTEKLPLDMSENRESNKGNSSKNVVKKTKIKLQFTTSTNL